MEEYLIYFSRPIFHRVKQLEDQVDQYTQANIIQEEGVIQCGKCKSRRVFTTSKQTRGADEPMTVFCYCINCKSRWTE